MNTLTVNSFVDGVILQPPTKRDTKSFVRRKHSSDQYMFQSQVNFRYKADDALVEIKRRDGEHNIHRRCLAKKLGRIGWF
jgi:kynureninase